MPNYSLNQHAPDQTNRRPRLIHCRLDLPAPSRGGPIYVPEDEERARKGGLVIAQRGSEHFRQLAAA